MYSAYVNFWVDDIYTSVPRTFTVLQACSVAGIEVPRFCYHEKLSIAGNCRMCLVEVNNSKKLVASCAVPISENLRIYTSNLRVKKARESVLEFLLANHPLDCPICDQGGECDLQDITMSFGSDRGRFYEVEKRAVEDKNCGPLIKTVMTRCIHCTRCIRFISEVSGYPDFGTTGRGSRMEVGSYASKILVDELSANIIDLCPVGALTSKPYAFTSRPWELTSIESVDVFDALCSNIRLNVYGNKIKRVLPRINETLNEDWITNKARFVYDSFDTQRVSYPMLNLGKFFIDFTYVNFFNKTTWISISWRQVLVLISYLLNRIKISFSFGPFCDVETIWSYKNVFNNLGLFHNSNNLSDYSIVYFSGVRVKELESYSLFLSVNSYLRTEMPLLNSRVRKSYNYYMSSFKFYAAGVGSNYFTYPIKTFANNKLTILNFFLGKSYFSKIVNVLKSRLVLFYNCTYSHFNHNFIKLFNPIFVNVHSSTTSVTANHLGVLENSYLPNFSFYSVGGSLDVCSPIIYQGHHGINNFLDVLLVLPTSIFAEKSSTYLNFEGLSQVAHSAITPSKFVKKDWEVFIALQEFQSVYKVNFANNFKDLSYSSLFCANSTIKQSYWTINNSFYSSEFIKSCFIKNSIFSLKVFNYYWNDSFSKNSKTMANCAKYIVNRNFNYI